jgi:hypothetical protein
VRSLALIWGWNFGDNGAFARTRWAKAHENENGLIGFLLFFGNGTFQCATSDSNPFFLPPDFVRSGRIHVNSRQHGLIPLSPSDSQHSRSF